MRGHPIIEESHTRIAAGSDLFHTGSWMASRLWAFALAFVLFAAPLSPAVCGLTCAHETNATAGRGEHHSCHEASTDSATVSPAPHPCGHQIDGLVGLEQLVHVLNPPALAASAVVDIVVPGVAGEMPRAAALTVSPPGLPLNTPLRL